VEGVEACLRFAYTDTLPEGPLSVSQLLSLFQKAGFLGMEVCEEAALTAIAAFLPASISVEEAGAVFALEHLPDTPFVTKAQDSCLKALLLHLGDVVAVMNSRELKEQLLSLPLRALVALVSSHKLATDIEDSVLALVGCWISRHKPSSQQCQQLACTVRMAKLSNAFFTYVVPALAWLGEHFLLPTHAALVEIRRFPKDQDALRVILKGLPPAWTSSTKRPQSPSGSKVVVLLHEVTRQVLVDDLLPKLKNKNIVTSKSPTRTFAFGFELWFKVYVNKAKNTVGLYLHADLPMEYNKEASAAWRLSVKLFRRKPGSAAGVYKLEIESPPRGWCIEALSGCGFGIFYPPECKSITNILHWEELLLSDGALRIKAEVSTCK
jgi:hypothetical protein